MEGADRTDRCFMTRNARYHSVYRMRDEAEYLRREERHLPLLFFGIVNMSQKKHDNKLKNIKLGKYNKK